MSSIDLATWFKIGMYLLNREKRLNKVDCYLVDNKKKQVFEKNIFKCVTQPDLSGVPLTYNMYIIVTDKCISVENMTH